MEVSIFEQPTHTKAKLTPAILELGLRQARAATSVLFETAVASIRSEDVINALSSDPRLKLVSEGNSFIGEQVTKLAATYKLTRSRCEFPIKLYQVPLYSRLFSYSGSSSTSLQRWPIRQ
jgi:hypothetical protein